MKGDHMLIWIWYCSCVIISKFLNDSLQLSLNKLSRWTSVKGSIVWWTRLCLHGTSPPISREQEKSIRCPFRHNRKKNVHVLCLFQTFVLTLHHKGYKKMTKTQNDAGIFATLRKVSHQFQCAVRCVKVSSLVHNFQQCSWSMLAD